MLETLIESPDTDDVEMLISVLKQHANDTIKDFCTAGGQLSDEEEELVIAELSCPFSEAEKLQTLQQLFVCIRKKKQITQRPFNAFLCAYCTVEQSDKIKASVIQGRIILAALNLKKRKGFDDVITRALNAVRLILASKSSLRLFEALPDFSGPLPKLISELEKLKKPLMLQLAINRVNSIIALLKYYQSAQQSYKKRVVIRDGQGTSTPPDYTTLPDSFGRDNDEPEVRIYAESGRPDDLIEPIESEVDNRPTRRFFEIQLIAPKDVSHSLCLKNQLAKNAFQHILKREKQLSTDYHQLTARDVSSLLAHCLQESKSIIGPTEGSFLLASLFLGRTVDELSTTSSGALDVINPNTDDARMVWLYSPTLPEHSMADGRLEVLLNRSGGSVTLIIPHNLILLSQREFKIAEEIVDLDELNKQLLQQINHEYGTRLTLPRIANYLSYWLSAGGYDATEIALLSGKSLLQEPGCYYYQVSAERLRNLHQHYISHLNSLQGAQEYKHAELGHEEQVGSNLQVRIEKLKHLFEGLVARIRQEKSRGLARLRDFHNYYTLYILYILNLSTGHRPVRHPYHSIECVDLDAKTIFISDKEGRGGLSARVLVLPEIARTLLLQYLEHLHQLGIYYQNIDPANGHKITSALSGASPLFFFIKKEQIEFVTPKGLTEFTENIFPIPLNWNRHLMRTWLRTQKLHGHVIDAWMGHIGTGGDGFARYSGLSMADLHQVAAAINHFLKQLAPLELYPSQHKRASLLSQPRSMKFGFEQREEKRKLDRKRIQKHVHHLIGRYLPQLQNLEVRISPDDYKTGVRSLLHQLEQDYPGFAAYRFARNCFSQHINNGNKEGQWYLEVPAYIQRVQREGAFRNIRWFQISCTLNSLVRKWFQVIAEQPDGVKDLSEEQAFGSCLISAALFGGLCLPEALKALKEKLETHSKPLTYVGGFIYMDLMFEAGSEPHNIATDEGNKTLRRWFPDTVTLAWIHHYFTKRARSPKESITTWQLISRQLKTLDKATLRKIKHLNSFCLGAIGVAENMPGVLLNQALVGYSVGKVSSSSLPPPIFEQLFGQKQYKEIDKPLSLIYAQKDSAAGPRSLLRKVQTNYERYIADIRQALTTHNSHGIKRSANEAAQVLNHILNSTDGTALGLMVAWMINLLDNKLKVSSVNRYWTAIGKPWLAQTADVQLDKLDAEEFESLYQDMLDGEVSDYNRAFMAGRLEQFHLYMHRFHEFPLLLNALSDNARKPKPFVQAAFIPEEAFSAFLATLLKLNEEEQVIRTLRCLFILAFRTGMRRGELIKLRMEDIEDSSERWIFVRNNRYGNNKSSSGLRKIPLAILLTEGERKEFEAYYGYKKQLKSASRALLFSEPVNPYSPLNAGVLNTLYARLISALLDVPSTFHDLRHTALSRLQLILEGEPNLIAQLTTYTAEQINAIQQCMGCNQVTSVKRDIYWAIAGFAGHSTPEITFTNYLHFTDLIAATRLRYGMQSIPEPYVKNASGLTSNALTRIAKEVKQGGCRESSYLEQLKQRLGPFTNRIKWRQQNTKQSHSHFLFEQLDPTIEQCYAVLVDAESGATSEELSLRYGLDQSLINKWLENAEELYRKSTQKGRSRLFSKYKVKPSSGRCLAPGCPQSNDELDDVRAAIITLKELYKHHPHDVQWCFNYFLERTTTTNPGIPFARGRDVKRFLKIMGKLFPAKRWWVSLQLIQTKDEEAQKAYWKRFIHLPINNNSFYKSTKSYKYPHGRVVVSLKHPNEKVCEEGLMKTYSTNTLNYIIHMLLVMFNTSK